MANASILTEYFKTDFLLGLIEDINENPYYLMVGNHNPTSNSSLQPTAPNNNIHYLVEDVYFNAIFGKIITSDDVLLMIRNVPYVVNTVYSMYDDNDLNLFESDFFVIVNEGTYSHVYKCIDNNNDAPSTVQPAFVDVNINDSLFELSDGYRWKYMYSADATTVANFGGSSYFPVWPNTAVQSAATPGSIDVIKTDFGGIGYGNWWLGTFSGTDLRVNGNPLLYNLSIPSGQNSSPSSSNGFYEGCVLYISSGSGIGQFKNVVSYFVTNTGNYVQLDSNFAIVPGVNDTFEIYPQVQITGGGTQTINAQARAIINAVGNSVARVEMLNVGLNYNYATANVYANSIVSVSATAQVRPIYSPPGGHGSDPGSELRAVNLGFSVQFKQGEAGVGLPNTIPISNDYRQLSIIKDPTFANAVIQLSNVAGNFQLLEPVYKVTPQEISANVSIGAVNVSSNLITTSTGNFLTDFNSGDFIYISNGSVSQLSTVWQVINSSALMITAAGAFSCSAAYVYFPGAELVGTITTITGNTITLTGVKPNANVFDLLVGNYSGATGNVSSITRSGVSKSFNTFIANWQYPITYSLGNFQEDEVVYQGTSLNSATATAVVHSVSAANVLLVTQQVGSINLNANLIGANSGAIATPTAKYYPEVVYGSAEILYVENIIPVTRNNQTDVIRLNINLGL